MSTRCLKEIENSVRAGFPLLYLVTWEEERAITDLVRLAGGMGAEVCTWSVTSGLCDAAGRQLSRAPSAKECLEEIARSRRNVLYVLRDAHPDLRDRVVIRLLRDLALVLKETGRTVVLVSPVLTLPVELEKDVRVIDYDLPGQTELVEAIEDFLEGVGQAAGVALTPDEVQELAVTAKGLTATELENVLAKALVEEGALRVSAVVREKEQLIRKTGLLEYCHSLATLDDVGGLKSLKRWLDQRAKAFSAQARRFGLPLPRGVLLLGVQGCGKSLCAKAVAKSWGLPLLRLDVGKLYSAYVGASEENVRRVTAVCEAVAPAVLWLDELEKGLSGMASSGYCDSGTTARVFGSFITWLQEKEAPVFVVATANDLTQLPPELLRKGRFDEIFFVDLPDEAARREIWAIHLGKVGRDPAGFDLARLAAASAGMSGAEIEQVVAAALYEAFQAGETDLTNAGLLAAIEATVPLSQTMAEEIAALRNWAVQRARPAS